MRKRSPQRPFRCINNAHALQASSAAVCDNSSSSLFCFPFFYFLLITWIVLLSINPTLSRYSGSYSWSIPWPSGVHADRNSGEQKVEDNVLILNTQGNLVPSNESNLSNQIQSGIQNKISGPRSLRDLKCRPPTFKELVSLSTVSVRCCSHGRSCSCRTVSNRKFKSSARRHVLLHANEGRDDSQQLDSDNEESLHHEGKLKMQRDEVLNDTRKSVHGCLDEQGTHVHADDDKEFQTKQQIGHTSDHHMHDNDNHGGDHYNSENVDNERHYHTPPPTDESTYNETGSVVTMSGILNRTHPALTNLSRAHLRQDPGDGLYNYAADSKGAKILASNKEAKGASNILNKDRDKYFRTPCNVETKFVDMELSEETLVVQVVIANHEFYSSNVRGFEVWGSLTYPTDEWLLLGKFEAENSRVCQAFSLREPQWVRYLKLQMLSHYGSDFYCTLSMVEVYGVDAIESFLEEWIAEEAGVKGAQTLPSQENSSFGNKGGSPVHSHNPLPEKDAESENEIDLMLTQKLENTFTDRVGDVSEGKGKNTEKPQSTHHQAGRPALDAVMKLLMQKVRSLEHKEHEFSQQIKNLDEKHKEASRAHSKEQLILTSKLQEAATEIANLTALLQSMERKWDHERLSLQNEIFNQVKAWNADMMFLRSELSRMENKELVALAVSFFSIVAVAGSQVLMLCVPVLRPEQNCLAEQVESG